MQRLLRRTQFCVGIVTLLITALAVVLLQPFCAELSEPLSWILYVGAFLFIGVLLWFCSMFIAKRITKRMISPLVHIAENLENCEGDLPFEELREVATVLVAGREEMLKNAKVRQEFTANVSHELKTPLTAISGYAELIETGMASGEDVVHFANGIHSNANRLLTLINDTIRLSELDGTSEEIHFEQLNLFSLASQCVETMEMSANKHHVKVTLSGEDGEVFGNKQMLEELLFNLCDNAIRYNNENGEVLVAVTTGKDGVKLVVKDTGIGIPMEHQERIFERFYRVDKSRSKQTGGTGLGLAIVKHIVARHHAEITLHSKEGEGTEIGVKFPVTQKSVKATYEE